MTSTTGVIC